MSKLIESHNSILKKDLVITDINQQFWFWIFFCNLDEPSGRAVRRPGSSKTVGQPRAHQNFSAPLVYPMFTVQLTLSVPIHTESISVISPWNQGHFHPHFSIFMYCPNQYSLRTSTSEFSAAIAHKFINGPIYEILTAQNNQLTLFTLERTTSTNILIQK